MNNRSFGDTGEQFVVQYLQKNGFTVQAVNYRKFFGEIDIIASKQELYVFVEVKTRKSVTMPMGQLISRPKQQKIIKTAQTFIVEQKLRDYVYRFDVALVSVNGTSFVLEYIENAFTKPEDSYANNSY